MEYVDIVQPSFEISLLGICLSSARSKDGCFRKYFDFTEKFSHRKLSLKKNRFIPFLHGSVTGLNIEIRSVSLYTRGSTSSFPMNGWPIENSLKAALNL